MEKILSIKENLKNMTDEEIITNQNKPIKSIILVSVAIILLILGIVIKENTLKIITLLGCLTFFIIFIIDVVNNRIKYIYKPTGKALKKYSCYLNATDARFLIDTDKELAANHFDNIKKYANSTHLLDVMCTDDGAIALYQISEYIPYTFEIGMKVKILRGEQAKSLMRFSKSSKIELS